MGGYDLHSLILSCDFRVRDVDLTWKWMEKQRPGLQRMGAHHVVLYKSIWEPGRILVTIGIRNARSIREVLQAPAIFEWFDTAGVEDIPPIFGGEVVEKIDLAGPSPKGHVAGVIVGAVATVDDVPTLMRKVHDGLSRFEQSGIRKIWVYQALDNGQEVMILQEVSDEISARQWIDHPDAAAEWMTTAGFGAYPSLFVGKLAYIMTVDEPGD
ncbi:fatty-acid--CoA ligase [Mycobacterium sp. TNTM28]|uniref:Fatty-acid--CoA ligase n=1 Tax=[Mycobacterium] fortunisiensis TaxID=2600579 RepID=A0ABS6KNY8_9MYCO|nr:fatty-acid--CoA ligase [[Mycobacterium] fortunisiensis]MBU9765230.1 fatty-acid--CoA ligase [[Mycobacterium] fortunisiensis]